MIFEKIGIKPQALKALIGAIIVKFSTSIITCWGNINLYLLSQFHHQGTKITHTTNSTIFLFSVPPMVVAMLYANRLCQRFGYELVVRMCSAIFCLSPLLSYFFFNIYMFTIFSVLIPGSMFALISIPILNCIWSQFPESKNKSTAILVIAFGLGGIVWNFLFMHMINPNNQDTIDDHQSQDMSFFSRNVTRNVRQTALVGFLVTGVLAVLGSLLLERNSQAQDQLKEQKQPQQMDAQNSPDTSQNLKKKPKKAEQLTYSEALKDQRFIIIMIISILTGFYQIYLMMSFKIIYMPIISDDHFLSYSTMICSVVSIAGAFFWGFMGDWKGIHFTILLLSVLDLGSKIFSDFAMSKPTIVVMVVLIGVISRSMTTIAGPGFVEIFGLKLGTELLPLKGVAIILGYVIVPALQIATSKYLDPHEYLICISLFSIITMACAIRLYMIKCKQDKQNTEKSQSNKKSQSNEKQGKIQENYIVDECITAP